MDQGGAERTTLEMTRAIVGAGGKAIIATRGGRLVAELVAAGGKVEQLPVHSKNPITISRNAVRLMGLIRAHNVDLVHARSRAPAWSALIAARRCNIPKVTTYHGAYRSNSTLKRLLNSSMVRADKVIANSNFTANEIVKAYKSVESRIVVVPRGADLTQFSQSVIAEERITTLAKQWGISRDQGSFVFLLPARFTEWKGHSLVIEALRELKSHNFPEKMPLSSGATGHTSKFSVVFVGDVEADTRYVSRLQDEIDGFGVRDMTSFVGHCTDMPAAYGLADAVLSPSLRPEAFGRVAVEAGAMGKVAIVADHGGARETILPGETGFRHQPGDAKELARMMVDVATMPKQELKAIGDRALKNVRENFSTHAMANATLGVYKSLLETAHGLG